MEWWQRALPLADFAALARRRIRLSGLLAAAVTIVLLVAAQGVPRQALFDLYQKVLPAPAAGSGVAVVVVDAKSLETLGGWPLSRYDMARITREIGRRQASAIGFDIFFPKPDRQDPAAFVRMYPELPPEAVRAVRSLPTFDAVFGDAIGRYHVVLARIGTTEGSNEATPGGDPTPTPKRRFTGPSPRNVQSFPTLIANTPTIDAAAAGHGLINGQRETGAITRAVPLLARIGGHLTPSLALELVRVAERQVTIVLEGSAAGLTAVRVGRHRTPVSPDGQLWLRLAGRYTATAYSPISAADLFGTKISDDAFRGKIVVVGQAALGSDLVATPREPRVYGVMLQAQLVDAILSGRGLARPGWAAPAEWTAGLVLTLFAWLGVPRARLRLTLAIAGTTTVAAFGVSALAFQSQLLIDPAPVLLPAAATAFLMVILLFVEGRKIEAQLRGDLDAERLGAARLAGEMSAARDIQAGMLLPRPELARITPAVEIDAVLQPARMIGGDFYDVFMIDPDRLCFLIGDVTGKGPPASLFMALSKAHARSFLMRPGIGLGEAVQGINAELLRDNRSSTLVTLLVGILDIRDGRLELCRAGHDNPIVVGATGAARELDQPGFLPLCGFEDTPYTAGIHRLEPGEVLVAYTDGLTEAIDPVANLYGHARAMRAVETAAQAGSLVEMVDAIIADVRAFEAGREATDDLAVLALRRRPGQA